MSEKLKKKSDALPEYINTDKDLFKATKGAIEARQEKALAEKEEKNYKKDMIANANDIRKEEINKGTFIGVIKIISTNMPACRIEFRINNGALNVNQMSDLDRLFGGLRPALFEKAEAVTEITDPQVLYDSLVADGKNPWDYLSLGVKKNMDVIVSKYDGCLTAEAILPKKGLLARLKDNASTLSDEAMAWIKTYLEQALKTTPVLGTK